ncbi:YkvA family protein [Cereibacter sp. SYSU M97828]|nr:YkvA family protein [Cereibacter flavus]
MLDDLKLWAGRLRRDVVALWIAARDRRTPLAAKLVAGFVAAYALSPIDLIPDFIPVLGFVDDLIVLPLGIALVLRMIPPALMDEFRNTATAMTKPKSLMAALGFVCVWMIVIFVALKLTILR